MSTFRAWIIRVRDEGDEGGIAEVVKDYMAFNTMKFGTYGHAVAYARDRGLHPADWVICHVEFESPKVLEVRNIDYARSEIAVAT